MGDVTTVQLSAQRRDELRDYRDEHGYSSYDAALEDLLDDPDPRVEDLEARLDEAEGTIADNEDKIERLRRGLQTLRDRVDDE